MMPRIDIDDQVFKHLQANAVAFVETPNDTIRRLLGIDPAESSTSSVRTAGIRKLDRKPKASLGKLVRAGVVKIGQRLYLHDYRGNRIEGAEAIVGGDGIFSGPDRKRLC